MNDRRRSFRTAVLAGVVGFAIAFAAVPPPAASDPAVAAQSNYFMGTLAPNVKKSSGTKSSVIGGRSNFYIVGHWYNVRTENVAGNIYQTTTTYGEVAEMNHSRVYSYFSLCWWKPVTSGSWSPLNAACLYYY